MDHAFVERINAQIAFETARSGPPDGFPKLPDLPLGRYTSREFFELERQQLFRKTWLFCAHTSEFPNAGSYRTMDLAGMPLLLVKDEDGKIRAFFNACRHRGAPVVRDDCGECRLFTCQYHSWTYDLQGALRRVPDERDFVGLDKTARALSALRCEQWAGLVFVNADTDTGPLAAWLDPLVKELEALERLDLRVVHRSSRDVGCNWKILAEGFLEVYHVRTIHPETVANLLDHRGAAMGLLRNGHTRMYTPLRPEVIEAGRETHRGLPLLADDLAEPWFTTNPAYGIFPNLITPLDPRGFPLLAFVPMGPDRTRLDLVWLGKDWGSGERPQAWEKRLAAFDKVMEEDTKNLEPIQRSTQAAAHTGIPLNYQERRIWHFHATIDKLVGPWRVPAGLRVADSLSYLVEP